MDDNKIVIYIKATAYYDICPVCGNPVSDLHNTYHRRIQTYPIRSKCTYMDVIAYKFNCTNIECNRKVIMPNLPFVTPSQRKTDEPNCLILAVSMFLSNDGEYDERTILNHIEIYTQNIKTKGKLSPIVELKDFHYMEDKEIQEKLNQIDTSIKEMSLEQTCDLFNFLIPLLDMGFMYNKYSDFNQALKHVLKEIDVYKSKNSLLYDVVDNHTTLKDKQHEQFIKAIQEVKDKVREKSIPKNRKMETLLKRYKR